MAAPSVHERVKKLESRGVIRGYAADVDPAAVGPVRAGLHVGHAGAGHDQRGPDAPTSPRSPRSRSATTSRARRTTSSRSGPATWSTWAPSCSGSRRPSDVFSTETDVVFTTGFEGRPLPIAPQAGRDRRNRAARERVTDGGAPRGRGRRGCARPRRGERLGGGPRGALRPARRRRPCRRAPAHRRPGDRRGGRAGDVPGPLEPGRAVRSGGRVARDVAPVDRPQPDGRPPARDRAPPDARVARRGPRTATEQDGGLDRVRARTRS